jgi:hypothetical protein
MDEPSYLSERGEKMGQRGLTVALVRFLIERCCPPYRRPQLSCDPLLDSWAILATEHIRAFLCTSKKAKSERIIYEIILRLMNSIVTNQQIRLGHTEGDT